MAKQIGSLAAILSANSTAFSAGFRTASNDVDRFSNSFQRSMRSSFGKDHYSHFNSQSAAANRALHLLDEAATLSGNRWVASAANAAAYGTELVRVGAHLTGTARSLTLAAVASGGLAAALTAGGATIVTFTGIVLANKAAGKTWVQSYETARDTFAGLFQGITNWIEGVKEASKATEELSKKLQALRKHREQERQSRQKAEIEQAERNLRVARGLSPNPIKSEEARRIQRQADSLVDRDKFFSRQFRHGDPQEQAKAAQDAMNEALQPLIDHEEAMRDQWRENEKLAQKVLIQSRAAKESQFERDPLRRTLLEFQERIDFLKSTPAGADFGISQQHFGGSSPVGELIGAQNEAKEANGHLKEIRDLQKALLDTINRGGLASGSVVIVR